MAGWVTRTPLPANTRQYCALPILLLLQTLNEDFAMLQTQSSPIKQIVHACNCINIHPDTKDILVLQEAGGWVGNKNPSSSQHPTVECSANAGGSVADPTYDNPTYQIMSSSDFSLTPQLTLTILLQSWPQNSYPFLIQLPQASVMIIAGMCS